MHLNRVFMISRYYYNRKNLYSLIIIQIELPTQDDTVSLDSNFENLLFRKEGNAKKVGHRVATDVTTRFHTLTGNGWGRGRGQEKDRRPRQKTQK